MLESLAVLFFLIWLVGLVTGYTLGGFIYVCLLLALILFIAHLLSAQYADRESEDVE